MGLFDRFRKPASPEVPPAGAAVPSSSGTGGFTAGTSATGPTGASARGNAAAALPPLPFNARIKSFDLADAVGRLVTEAGLELRFGRSACKGFEPVVGAQVVVEAVAPHPLGFRAQSISLAKGDDSYDALLAGRDEAAGKPRETPEQAIGAAVTFGWITVLLREPITLGVQGLRRWAEAVGLEAAGVEVKTEDRLSFRVGRTDVLAYPANVPYPKERMDLRQVGEDFDRGRAFVALGLGDVAMHRQTKALLKGDRRDWGEDGPMRNLSRLVLALLPHATGVVLNLGGELVVESEFFAQRLGDLADPEYIPFAAWLDIAVVGEPQRTYRTFGMSVFGLPDVCARVEEGNDWQFDRRAEAVLFAAQKMAREERELRPGEELRVPLGVSVGAYPPDEDGEEECYRVCAGDGDTVLLEPAAPAIDAAARWAAASRATDPEPIAPNTYRLLFRAALDAAGQGQLVDAFPSRNPNRFPHVLEVRRDGDGWRVLTNGFGRMVQSGGRQAGVPRIELALETEQFSQDLLDVLGTISRGIDLREPDDGAWKVGDSLRFAIESRGIGGFVFADGGEVELPGGAPIQVLVAVPLSPSEYPRVRDSSRPWLEKHAGDPRQRARLRSRWSEPLP